MRDEINPGIVSFGDPCGCGGDKIREVPDGVISRDTMVMVLAETHIINAKFQHREARRMKFTDLLKVEQLAMYDSLGISEEKG